MKSKHFLLTGAILFMISVLSGLFVRIACRPKNDTVLGRSIPSSVRIVSARSRVFMGIGARVYELTGPPGAIRQILDDAQWGLSKYSVAGQQEESIRKLFSDIGGITVPDIRDQTIFRNRERSILAIVTSNSETIYIYHSSN